jgi:ATP-dependent DNA helicase DinG
MIFHYVALDLETTGLDPARDEIIEVGAVRFSSEGELSAFETLINPGCPIPSQITRLTGISDSDVTTAPRFSRVRDKLVGFVGDAAIIGHNIRFDLEFLHRQDCLRRHPFIDTLELATILMPNERRYGLGKLLEQFGIDPGRGHRALDDARSAMRLLSALQDRANRLPLHVLRQINAAARSLQWPPKAIFEEAARRTDRGNDRSAGTSARPSDVMAESPARYRLVPREHLVPVDNRTALDTDALTAMLEPGGALERSFTGFEYRPQQVEMMQAVVHAFNHSQHLVVEAGTGTGKSIAYLLPAVYWAAQNGERVVVSTNTINLQDQLYGKDIPDLRDLLSCDVRAAVLKGRSNYLCLRRLEALQRKEDLTMAELRVLTKVLVWLTSTESGDRAELSMYQPEEWAVWARISSDADMCTADRCWYRRQGRCFYQLARLAAESAHIVIVNHALLLSDVVTENRVLPQYNYLIVDEAHHLEDATTHQLGYSIGRWNIEALIAQIGLGEGTFGGFAAEMMVYCQGQVPGEVLSELDHSAVGLCESNARVLKRLRGLFEDLVLFVAEYKETQGQYDYRIRLTHDLRIQPEWERVEVAWDGVSEQIQETKAQFAHVLDVLGDLEGQRIPGYDDLVQDGLGLAHQLDTICERMESVLLEPKPNEIYWVQTRAKTDEVLLCAVPLRVGHLVEQHLLWTKEGVVLTSATLRTNDDFTFIKERLGAADAEELAVGSPFDYESQVLLYLPTDIPEPNEPYHQKQLIAGLIELAVATQGRMLVLFTSYRQLHAVGSMITSPLAEHNITVYAQGQGVSRSQLLDSFRTTPKAVLLGTRSFWEGVDIPGEALSCLVVTKLPFAVPTDPVFAARAEDMDDPFLQFAVPDAILRFRQGFGRLIRTRSDRGVVVVMDRRVQTKSYGRMFINSLPTCTTVYGPMVDLPNQAAQWLSQDGAVVTGAAGAPTIVEDGELEYVSFDDL